jgi:hypothetical protein
VLRTYVTFFQLQMRLMSKARHGARVARRYDTARTSHQRLWSCQGVELGRDLYADYRELNPWG